MFDRSASQAGIQESKVSQQIEPVSVGSNLIGPGRPVFVIAKAGVNHNGDVGLARQLVEAAAEAEADAVKFQTFRATALASERAEKAAYQVVTTGSSASQRAMLERLQLPDEAYRELQAHAKKCSIQFLSTPFDQYSVELLAGLDVPAFKVSSGDLTTLPLLRQLAPFGKPIILSTGMGNLGEIEEALSAIHGAGSSPVILLHCVSSYPAAPDAVNLRAMDTLALAFRVPVGYSDHTLGMDIAVAAVARGACVIEKHMTLDRNLPGPDHRASLEPAELGAMVRAIRKVEIALGDGRKVPHASEADVRRLARKSIVVVRAMPAGQRVEAADVALLRPGTGLPPRLLDVVVGRRVARDVAAGTPITWDDLR